mmetsp:Transcript_6114/g.13705  ORF Transcript_6114/g.13705 Transcript_6114/m.13705 type:complete len:240 (-) Transcript_6114:847-1566(-)
MDTKQSLYTLLLACSLGLQACTQVSVDKLHGAWRFEDDMELPNTVCFHPSGRYIVLNDFQPDDILPIVEKGNWHLNAKTKQVKLTAREILAPNANFEKYYGTESTLMFHITELSAKTLTLSCKDDNDILTERYKKVRYIPNKQKFYSGIGTCIEKISLGHPHTRLKISWEARKHPAQLVIEDQEGNAIFKTRMQAMNQRQHYEILLADLPNALAITELILKVTSRHPETRWKCGVKVYW